MALAAMLTPEAKLVGMFGCLFRQAESCGRSYFAGCVALILIPLILAFSAAFPNPLVAVTGIILCGLFFFAVCFVLFAKPAHLPARLRNSPLISAFRQVAFTKRTSCGRDLTIYCGVTDHKWNAELLKAEGVGGSEESVIYLSRELAKLGWNVTVYNNCGPNLLIDGPSRFAHDDSHTKDKSDGLSSVVTYRPYWEWNYRDRQDVTIFWRFPGRFNVDVNSAKVFFDLHDIVLEHEFSDWHLAKIGRIFVKSKFHRSLLPNIPDEKFAIIPNGLDFSLLESQPPIKKDRYLMINTSSPDRSMDALSRLFGEVKKRVPQARLQWAYGWQGFENRWANDAEKCRWMKQTQKAMVEAGIEPLGRLTQAEVGKLYQRASILAYPTEFSETDCISVKKAQAAYCKPIATDVGALKESIYEGVKVALAGPKSGYETSRFFFGIEDEQAQQEWVDAVVANLTNHWDETAQPRFRDTMYRVDEARSIDQWVRQLEWPKVAARWHEILEQA
jgi:glycosyltransferase involved in cell wall biosynthesis